MSDLAGRGNQSAPPHVQGTSAVTTVADMANAKGIVKLKAEQQRIHTGRRL
jgi:hypothetical protein